MRSVGNSTAPSTGRNGTLSGNLNIDPEIRDCLPGISLQTMTLLETLILERKVEPVVYSWNGLIWDGHRVQQICEKHNLPYQIIPFDAPSKEDAIVERIKRHIGRRNMSPPQVLEVVCRMEKTLLAEARKNQRLGPGKKAWTSGEGSRSFEKQHTNERIARWTGISVTTVKRFRKVRNFGDTEIIADMMSSRISINKAYYMVRDMITEAKRRSVLAQTVSFINPPAGVWENTLWHEDNQVTLNRMTREIPGQVDAFIFDPPWNVSKDYGLGAAADNLPYDVYLQELLKRFFLMAECLKVGGKIACIIEQTRILQKDRHQGMDAVRPVDADLIQGVRQLDCGLQLWDRIPYVMPVGLDALSHWSDPSPFCPRFHPRWGLVLVWGYKEFASPESDHILPDYTREEKQAWSITPWIFGHQRQKKHLHPGATPSSLVERIIRLLTYRGSLICDPYNGIGVITQLCRSLQRRYIGIEQNGVYCHMAMKATEGVA